LIFFLQRYRFREGKKTKRSIPKHQAGAKKNAASNGGGITQHYEEKLVKALRIDKQQAA